MRGRECYHCKQWIEEGEAHDCWTTTETALTADLSEDLRDAWERLRETAASFGEQRIYASHHSIMFSRNTCYFFVRPKKSYLEMWVFLDRPLNAPQVRRVERTSQTKVANMVRITHRDEVEPPITDWLREAYELRGKRPVKPAQVTARKPGSRTRAAARARTAGARRVRKASSSPAAAHKRGRRRK
jgi:hypothetical protein